MFVESFTCERLWDADIPMILGQRTREWSKGNKMAQRKADNVSEGW